MTRSCGTGAMACISRNCAPHGPHLSKKIHNTKVADQRLVPDGQYSHVCWSPNGVVSCSADAFHTCQEERRSQFPLSQPCLGRLCTIYLGKRYSFGTQVIVDLPALEVLESSGCRERRSWPESDVTTSSAAGQYRRVTRHDTHNMHDGL
jgi:hypothetical protein